MLNKLTIYIILKYSMSILTYGTLSIFDASTKTRADLDLVLGLLLIYNKKKCM